jgi:hypothetical protein
LAERKSAGRVPPKASDGDDSEACIVTASAIRSRRFSLKKNPRHHPPASAAPDGNSPSQATDSGSSASIPAIVAGAFERINIRLRARMLGRLLASVGDAARATGAQVHELVRYVQQSNPQLLNQLVDALARDTATIAALGASVAALTINRLATQARRRNDAK